MISIQDKVNAKNIAQATIRRIGPHVIADHLDINEFTEDDNREILAVMETLRTMEVVLPQDLDDIRREAEAQALSTAAAYIHAWIKAGADEPIHPYETAMWLEARAETTKATRH